VSQVPTPEITEVVDPVGHVQVIYLGPGAPLECRMVFGDEEQIQAFVDRVDARLRFFRPRPPVRRNRERVNRDAERENCSSMEPRVRRRVLGQRRVRHAFVPRVRMH